MDWYTQERRKLRALALQHNRTEAVAVGVTAALSPRMPWSRNLSLAAQALAQGTCEGLPALPRSKDQAERILHGERPLNVLRGPKVRAFYRALRGDTDACVIDTHMARALGHRGRFPEGRAYERLSNRLRARATRAGLPVSYYQALVWIKQRGRAW